MAQLPATPLDIRASYATFDDESGFTQGHKGTPIWKTVDDMARYRHVIEVTRPEIIVETGTWRGGFAAWLADTFGVEVVTVDIHQAEGRLESWPGVTFLVCDALGAVDRVRDLVAGKRTMVSLDDEHSAPHVRTEIELYGPLVSQGCHLVVEDGLVDLTADGIEDSATWDPNRFGHAVPEHGGPLVAISEVLVGAPGWWRDLETESLSPVSHHPAGWWLRTGARTLASD